MGDKQTTEGEAKGPDNNKRLAALEAGVALLTSAVSASLARDLTDADDVFALAIDRLDGDTLLVTDAKMLSDYVVANAADYVTSERTLAEAAIALMVNLEAAAATAVGRAEKAEELARSLEERTAELEGKLGGTAAEEAKVPKVKPRASSSRARTVKPPKDGLDPELLVTAAEAGLSIELVFVAGGREILTFEPIAVDPSGFMRQGEGLRRFVLIEPILLLGGLEDEVIEGVAAFAAGELVAHSSLPFAVTVPARQQVKLDKTVAFG